MDREIKTFLDKKSVAPMIAHIVGGGISFNVVFVGIGLIERRKKSTSLLVTLLDFWREEKQLVFLALM